ncbi:retrovirus-related Pol polyprotein from transposon 17.6 [Trichonephila clavipes]|nr:retrovirus-related Pol polyprotein from transposon 17.6 [Trichonephila clavipes]
MFDSSSFVNPTPLAHADTSRDVLPRGGASQGPYPVSQVRRKRYVLVITDHFSKCSEIMTLKKSSAGIIADSLFDNYISRYGAPVKLISDNGPQFISDIFEHLSNRLGIRHVKTVVYRPQANRA